MIYRYDDDEVHTRLPQKGRNKQKIKDKFRDIKIEGFCEDDEEDFEDFSIPEKINRKKK